MMGMSHPLLRLPGSFGEKTSLVPAVDAIRLCRHEGYELVPTQRARWLVGTLGPRDLEGARLLLSQLRGGRAFPTGMTDANVLKLLRDLVAGRELVAVREAQNGNAGATDSTAKQRRLVRAIQALTRGGRLSFAGRDYRLVPDVDLARLPDRDSYEVASFADAQQVLSALEEKAETSGELGKLLGQARSGLSRDWRPPFEPDGLILLRRLPQRPAGTQSSESAITPSQMKKLVSDWIEIEVVDEDGVPYTGSYSLELPSSESIDGTFDDKGSYGNYAIDSGNCKLFLPGKKAADDAQVTVVDETGKAIANVALVFNVAESSFPATTDGAGIAKCKLPQGTTAQVSFASAADLAKAMKATWANARKVDRKDWVKADDSTTTVSLFGGAVVKAVAEGSTADGALPEVALEPFAGVAVTPGTPAKLSVQPLVILVTMLGQHFDTDKCFLVPKALDSVRDLVRLHRQYQDTDVLLVGHTDTSGNESYNLDLSLERTSAMRAYLTDDADGWLAWYGDGKPASKRWGATEDTLMIGAVLDGSAFPPTVLGYQQWHNASAVKADGYETLAEDGKIGPKTRKQLILDYMHREDTTVPEGTVIKVHGCGELFPLDPSGAAVDTNAEDGQDQPEDRRVEVFLFPKEIGIAPPPPGDKATKDEPEYLEWRRRSAEVELSAGRPANCVVSVILVSNSANVVLANRPYELHIENGPVLEGKTDSEGFLEHTGVPAGDHTLVVDGFESRVGATPPAYRRRRHMMAGYVLIEGSDV
jgi:outer membrane protein OmpA-like peptidoglycan-associated protein